MSPPRSAGKGADTTGRAISPLYARYNGSMLGFFLAGAFAKASRQQYPVLRQRILDFLSELKIEPDLPMDHSVFVDQHSELSLTLIKALSTKSRLLCDFFVLSSLAMREAILGRSDPETARTSHADALGLMRKHKLPTVALSRFLKAVQRNKDGFIDLNVLHSASLEFLRTLLLPLPVERKTAFVAMPFHDPFPRLFSDLHRPVLQKSGYRAIRAWGGLVHEEYQPLLGTLMDRCGVMLADLTTFNLNVLLEAGGGLAREDMIVFLICDKTEHDVPSNIANLAVFQYNSKSRGWPAKARLLLTMQLALAEVPLADMRKLERKLSTSPRHPRT